MVLTSAPFAPAPFAPAAARPVGTTPVASGKCVLPDVLRSAVEARIGHRLRAFRVDVTEGVGVVLYGWSDCYHVKQLAQLVVGQVSGLRVLANRIAVVPPAAERA